MLTVPSPPDHFTSKHVSESTECSSGCWWDKWVHIEAIKCFLSYSFKFKFHHGVLLTMFWFAEYGIHLAWLLWKANLHFVSLLQVVPFLMLRLRNIMTDSLRFGLIKYSIKWKHSSFTFLQFISRQKLISFSGK